MVKEQRRRKGKGLINATINRLPFEAHVPGYQFCGPGTRLRERLAAGQKGVNRLDQHCREHDIAYDQSNDKSVRHAADRALQKAAMKRVFARDATLGERATAAAVAATMKLKRKIGGRLQPASSSSSLRAQRSKVKKRKKTMKTKTKHMKSFSDILKRTRRAVKGVKTGDIDKVASKALTVAQAAIKRHRASATTTSTITPPRIIPVPKLGGVLPLVPIFAGLSALGSLIGGTAAITSAVMRTKEANRKLNEAQRHNETMEAIALGRDRHGNGLYLRPYKTGLGLFRDQSKN